MNHTSSPRPRHLRVVPDASDRPRVPDANPVYGVVRKLSRGGNPEDRLRGPLEILIERIGPRYGLGAVPYGEVGLKKLRALPDYTVDIGKSQASYIDLKRLGRGTPPDWRFNNYTLRQVNGTIDWSLVQDNRTNFCVELYEDFLARYELGTQKESGSYYTSEPVAAFMVQFVDEMPGAYLSRPWGFTDDGIVAPAIGTGMFLVKVIKRVTDIVSGA